MEYKPAKDATSFDPQLPKQNAKNRTYYFNPHPPTFFHNFKMLDTMKSTIFIVVSTLAIIASIGRPETPAVGNPTLKPEALNCTVGDSTIIACYPFSGIDFVMQVHNGKTFVTTDAGQTVFTAEIYIANVGEWEAVNSETGEFIRVNTGTGVTEAYLNGEFSIYLPEKP